MSDTIAAISTPMAAGGIGVIRISGPEAQNIADRIFRSLSGKRIAAIPGYTALYGHITDGEETIDEAIALSFHAPKSFTGENVVELSCHGGIYILKRILSLLLKSGAKPAAAGEFTKRAFLNGKMDLAEAEAVMDIISASGREAARAAISAKEGALSEKVRNIRKKLVDLGAHLSAWADYPDDDIPQVDDEMLKTTLHDVRLELERLLSTFDTGRIIREGVETVIAGTPNAGKSTLMNLLSGCERSIVTSIAGTTRDVVEEKIMLGDIPLCLADTAGIRNTDDPVESIGVDMAKRKLQGAGLILAVFDSSRELSPDDLELIEEIKGRPAIAVINKSDLAPQLNLKEIEANFSYIVSISAKKGEGIDELQKAASKLLKTEQLDPGSAMLYTERQRADVNNALSFVNEAITAFESGFTLDAVTVSAEGAIAALLELTGERVSDTVVDEVFSKFCVGK